MKRFFSTFLLLCVVASSLVLSNNVFKDNNLELSAHESNSMQKSIYLTDTDVFRPENNQLSVSLGK